MTAAARLSELRADRTWTSRYFAGDPDALAEYDLLVWQLNHGDVPCCCPMPTERTALELEDDAGRKYDGEIPREVREAIAEKWAQERAGN